MKKIMYKPAEWASDLTCKIHVAFMNKVMQFSENPRERRLMMASAVLTCTSLILASAAHAEGGIAGMVSTAADQGDSIKTNAGKLMAAVGFVGAGYGGYNWWRKGREGEQSHIKGGQIFVPILAGAALGATGFVMLRAGESVGIQPSSQGALPE